ncbi:MAG: hypothetical protein CALGDGBN_00639 [Pseudomonadales bacterium]|nr:hypothetical protein [Pseudomonadales bacterium]
MSPEHDGERPRRPTVWQVLASVLAAGFGVQASRNRERDFRHGRASVFIVAGLLATLAFIGVLYVVVRLVLGAA